MNVSEYIVTYLKKRGITHFFGYQGTMIAYFVDALCRDEELQNHVCVNEQGAALAACGYAKATGKISVAYATSGPGAINLLQGVADAYYDSAPVLFITGQLNSCEYTSNTSIRQQGFQQTDIVSISDPITKMSVQVKTAQDIIHILPAAIKEMTSNRMGPVLLDIPMDVQKHELCESTVVQDSYNLPVTHRDEEKIKKAVNCIIERISFSQSPVFIFGNGTERDETTRNNVRKLVEKYKIPSITSMLAMDLIPTDNSYNYGFFGYAYGSRYANFILDLKTDLIVSLGARLCSRQIGFKRDRFAENAQIIRIDIDEYELNQIIHNNDISYCLDANTVVVELLKREAPGNFSDWNKKCAIIKSKLQNVDLNMNYRIPNCIIESISELIPEKSVITCDVGQHQVWIAQSYKVNNNQRVLFSGGHGAMGFALPASIGAAFSDFEHFICFAGDGSIQMNIQELQWIVAEKLPIKIIIMNNHSLGLIRQQQDGLFEHRHYGATKKHGYTTPDFENIAAAYGIRSISLDFEQYPKWDVGLLKTIINDRYPCVININLDDNSYAYPKTNFGQRMHNQYPYIDITTFNELIAL